MSKKQSTNYKNRPNIGGKYTGRGLIQLTGKTNYENYGKAIGVDLVNNPELAADPKYALLIALKYWQDNKLNELADKEDIAAITKKIQGGRGNLIERKVYYNKLKNKKDKKE